MRTCDATLHHNFELTVLGLAVRRLHGAGGGFEEDLDGVVVCIWRPHVVVSYTSVNSSVLRPHIPQQQLVSLLACNPLLLSCVYIIAHESLMTNQNTHHD